MSVKIRLSRIGKKQEPFYRVVVMDVRKKRDGECLQDLGTYDVVNGKLITFDEAGYQNWLSKGAQPTDSALKIYRLFKKVGVGVKPASKVASKKVAPKQAEVKEEQPVKEEVQ